jgi:phosphohistidine phosphatase SixA
MDRHRDREWPAGMRIALGAAALALAASAHGQTLSGSALVQRLQRGGCVLVMRHASSPMTPPDARTADPGNTKLERQLDARGRADAAAMGRALRALKIPIGDVWSSPTYRALETARLMELHYATPAEELGDAGQSMTAVSPAQTAWLKARAQQVPRDGTNAILITHMPNIRAAFPQWSDGLGDGETLVLSPDGRGGVTLVARVKITDWIKLNGQ